jgi:hypothetical protein
VSVLARGQTGRGLAANISYMAVKSGSVLSALRPWNATHLSQLADKYSREHAEHDGLHCVGGAPPVDAMVEHINVVLN